MLTGICDDISNKKSHAVPTAEQDVEILSEAKKFAFQVYKWRNYSRTMTEQVVVLLFSSKKTIRR